MGEDCYDCRFYQDCPHIGDPDGGCFDPSPWPEERDDD